MTPTVDVDAKSLVSVDEAARWAGSRWALPYASSSVFLFFFRFHVKLSFLIE